MKKSIFLCLSMILMSACAQHTSEPIASDPHLNDNEAYSVIRMTVERKEQHQSSFGGEIKLEKIQS